VVVPPGRGDRHAAAERLDGRAPGARALHAPDGRERKPELALERAGVEPLGRRDEEFVLLAAPRGVVRGGAAHARQAIEVEHDAHAARRGDVPEDVGIDLKKLYFAPRKPRSGWAATNKARVERLIAAGRTSRSGVRRSGNDPW